MIIKILLRILFCPSLNSLYTETYIFRRYAKWGGVRKDGDGKKENDKTIKENREETCVQWKKKKKKFLKFGKNIFKKRNQKNEKIKRIKAKWKRKKPQNGKKKLEKKWRKKVKKKVKLKKKKRKWKLWLNVWFMKHPVRIKPAQNGLQE